MKEERPLKKLKIDYFTDLHNRLRLTIRIGMLMRGRRVILPRGSTVAPISTYNRNAERNELATAPPPSIRNSYPYRSSAPLQTGYEIIVLRPLNELT